jgi:hypothetical protein
MLDFSWQSAFLSDCLSKAALFPWKPSGFDNVAGVMQLCHLVRSHPFPPALELNEPVSDVVEYSNYPRIVLQRFTANLFKHRSRRFALLYLCLLTDNKTVLFALQYAYCNHAIRDPSQSPLSGPVRDIVLAEYAWYASLLFLRESFAYWFVVRSKAYHCCIDGILSHLRLSSTTGSPGEAFSALRFADCSMPPCSKADYLTLDDYRRPDCSLSRYTNSERGA